MSKSITEYDPSIYEGCDVKEIKYPDNTTTLLDSIITDGKSQQLSCAGCAIIAIFNSTKTFCEFNGIQSPWALSKFVLDAGMEFGIGSMLEQSDIESIANILGFRIRIRASFADHTVGSEGDIFDIELTDKLHYV